MTSLVISFPDLAQDIRWNLTFLRGRFNFERCRIGCPLDGKLQPGAHVGNGFASHGAAQDLKIGRVAVPGKEAHGLQPIMC